jgi:predicted PurR-regulated permease PerM
VAALDPCAAGVAVLTVVTLAFAIIAAFGTIVAWQVGDLARELPTYQRNIEAKIDRFAKGRPGPASSRVQRE